MNYEQKYKEALGWMQSLYKGLHGATKEEAEHYFPELKESEDEIAKMRETEIRQKAYEACSNYWQYKGFIQGAEWADAHPHWISVEDGLPQNGELVFAYNGKDYTISWCAKNKCHTNREMLDGAKPVTHWMPLPQPPKKGE